MPSFSKLGLLLVAGCNKDSSAQSSDNEEANLGETCPVSGEKIGSMGEAFVIDYQDRDFNLCCEECKDKFLADPAKYVAIWDAAHGEKK